MHFPDLDLMDMGLHLGKKPQNPQSMCANVRRQICRLDQMDNLKIRARTVMVVVMMIHFMMQRIVAMIIALMMVAVLVVMFMSVLAGCLVRFYISTSQREAKRPDRAALAF